ncbi:M48 family peptidase, partial [Testudinibacter sp. TR-2022]
MRNHFKAMTLALMLSVGLAGCADTQTINQQAASSYTQTINQMKQQGVIDTSSATSQRIQKVFQRIKPYAE